MKHITIEIELESDMNINELAMLVGRIVGSIPESPELRVTDYRMLSSVETLGGF